MRLTPEMEKAFRKKSASWTWDPDPTIQEFYDMCRDENDFYHNGFHYTLLWSETIEHGFDVACQNLNDLNVAYLIGWEEAIPRESFKSRMELISRFRLKNDGRTILEYYCDYYHKPRLLVPPVPTDYPNW